MPPPTAGKRFSPIPPPFHRVLRAENGQKLRVRLTAPTDADTCPLTMGPAAEDELDFLPGVTYLPGLAHVRLMTLPCQHAFGAMSLIYHFARQRMLCPCCRRGVDSPVASACLPQHFRSAMKQRVDASALAERREQLEEDSESARILQVNAQPFEDDSQAQPVVVIIVPEALPELLLDCFPRLESARAVSLSVFAHRADSELPPIASSLFTLLSRDDLDVVRPLRRMTFEMRPPELRRLAGFLQETDAPRVSLVVHARSLWGFAVQLARTEVLPARQAGEDDPRVIICPSDASTLILHYVSAQAALSGVTWIAEPRAFEPLLAS